MNKLGIICALRSEARCFTSGKLPAQQPVELNEKVLLILSGMGRERARQAAQALADAGADCLACFGTAGALAPSLRPGDLVLAAEVHEAGRKFTANGELTESVMKWLSRNGFTVHDGPLACAAQPVATIGAKQELFAQTGAMAVDMESAGVFDAAQRNSLPALALRVIIDAAHVALPDAALRRADEFGKVDITGLALHLASSPGQIPAVIRLACAARRAGRTMKQVAGLLLRHSPASPSPASPSPASSSPASPSPLRHSGLVPESSRSNRRPEGDSL